MRRLGWAVGMVAGALSVCLAVAQDAVQLEQGMRHAVSRISELEGAHRLAQAEGAELFFYGGTARNLAFFVREQLRLKGQAFFAETSPLYLEEVVGPYSDMDLIVRGTPEAASRIQASLQRQFPEGERFYKWDVRTEEYLKEPWQITQGYEPISKMLLGRGGFEEPEWRREAFGESLTERGAREVLSGQITYVRNPRYQESSPYQLRAHHEILEALRALRFPSEFADVELTPESLASVRAIIAEARASGELKEFLSNGLFRTRFEVGLQKLQYTSRDTRRLFEVLEDVALADLARESGFALRMPLAKAPPDDGGDVPRLGRRVTVYHGTKGGYKAAWAIARGGPFMTEYGNKGVYSSSDPKMALAYAQGEPDFVVRMELSPEARIGIDVEVTGETHLLKTDRAIESVERPLTTVELMGRLVALVARKDARALQEVRRRVETEDLAAIERAWPLKERLAGVLEEAERRPAAGSIEQGFREEMRQTLRAFDLARERAMDVKKAQVIEAGIDGLILANGWYPEVLQQEASWLALADLPKAPQRRVDLVRRLRDVVAQLLIPDQLATVQKTNPLLYLRLLPYEKRLRQALSESDPVQEAGFRREIEGFLQDLRRAKANVIDAEIGRFFELDANASYWSSKEAGVMGDWIATELPGLANRDQTMGRLKVAIASAGKDLSLGSVERNAPFLSHLVRYQQVLPDDLRAIREEVGRYAGRVIEDNRDESERVRWARQFLAENGSLEEVYARLAEADRERVLRGVDSQRDFLWKVVRVDPSPELRTLAWKRLVQTLGLDPAARSTQMVSVTSIIRLEPDPGVRTAVLEFLGPWATQELSDVASAALDRRGPAGFEDARETPAWRSGSVDSEFTRAAVWKALDGLERGDPEAVGAMRRMLEGWVRAGKLPEGPDGYFSSLRALAYFAKRVPEKEFQSLYEQAQELIARRVREVLETRPGSAPVVADAWSFLLEQMDAWRGLREFGRTKEVAVRYAVGLLGEVGWGHDARLSERSALEFLHGVGELEGMYPRMRSMGRRVLVTHAGRVQDGKWAPLMADFLRKMAESDPDPKLRWWAWRELLETDPSELRRLFPALAYEGVPEVRWLLRAEAARIAERATDPGLSAYLEVQEGFAEARRERAEARSRRGLTPLEGPLSKTMSDKVYDRGEDLRLTPAWGRAARTGQPFDGLPFGRAKVWKALEEGTDSALVEMRRMLEGWVREGKVAEGPDGYPSSLDALLEFASRAKERGGKAAQEFGEAFDRAQGVLAERAIEEIRGMNEKQLAFSEAVSFLFKLRSGDAVWRGFQSLPQGKRWSVQAAMDREPRPPETYFELLERLADSVPDPDVRGRAWQSLVRHERSAGALERILPYERNVSVQWEALSALFHAPPYPAVTSTIARFARETTDPQILSWLFSDALTFKVVAKGVSQRPDFAVLSRTIPRYDGTLRWDAATTAADARLTPAWQRAHGGPQNRAVASVRRWAAGEAMGAAQFGAAYLVKEAAKARSVRQLRESALAMKEPMFWGSLGVFSASAQVTRAGLRWVPMPRWARGVSMAAFPLAVGMGAMQGLAGRFSPTDLAISTGVFLGAGTVVDVAARVAMRSSAGWWLGVAKLAATLYIAEAVEGRLRPAAHGLRERIEEIVP